MPGPTTRSPSSPAGTPRPSTAGSTSALATGLYKKAGLDVTVKMGGPQVNGMQLLTAGQADLIMGYDFQVLSGVERGLPVTTVAASFTERISRD
jgi:NitT/TauT family transport system substrate-binding protein